ncbi:MAG: zinc-ribbon domain-containing protein [Thermodesulfobacteriota bacterium]
MPGGKPEKKISARSIMLDLKAGLSDKELMEKYGLSFQGLQTVFTQLIAANLATAGYFEKRAMQQATVRPVEEKTSTCPYCGFSISEGDKRCPRCGQDTDEWLDTVELTKILEGHR